MNSGTRFNLIDQPWILAQRLDGQVVELSIVDTVELAHDLRRLVGDLPTQVFAITRVLLAILHRSVAGPVDDEHWARLWNAPRLPINEVRAYLDRYRARFDLFHPETPFFQVADLHTAKNTVSGLEKLIADVPAGYQFFTTRIGEGLDSITAAEAARWLIHLQAFDISGIKSGAIGDPRVKGGKGYPLGTGWAGYLGGVIVEGSTLRETFILNMIGKSYVDIQTTEADVPIWERPALGAGEESPGGRHPYGSLDLFTWQSRRVRLVGDRSGVNGVLVCNGDRLLSPLSSKPGKPITPQNQHLHEPMTGWRRSQPQEKKIGTSPVYMPREHSPAKSMWRGINGLLPSVCPPAMARDSAAALSPATLGWIQELASNDLIENHRRFTCRAIGLSYGTQSAFVEDVIDDSVELSVSLIKESSPLLGQIAVDAVASCDSAGRAIARLAGNLAEAAGGESEGPRSQAQELLYSAFDAHYRNWISGLGPDSNPHEELASWHRFAAAVTSQLGDELIGQAGVAAWVGREVKGRHVDAPLAEIWFRNAVKESFPYAYPPSKTSDQNPATNDKEPAI